MADNEGQKDSPSVAVPTAPVAQTTTQPVVPVATPTAPQATTSTATPYFQFWNISAKDILENVVGLTTAWPLAMLLAVLLLRKQITPLFDRVLKASGWGVNLEFDKQLDKLTAIAEEANLNPSEAVPAPLPIEPTAEPVAEQPANADGQTDAIERAIASTNASVIEQLKQRVKDLKVQSLAKTFPSAAVVVAYSGLEAEAKAVGTALKIDPPTVDKVIKYLIDQGQLHPAAESIAKELRTLRNTAAHNPNADISSESAEKYSKLASDLRGDLERILRGFSENYTVVFIGGPDDGIIETGKDAQRVAQMAGFRKVKGENRFVAGKPEVGRGQKGMSHAILYALLYQHLTMEDCFRIYSTVGYDVEKVMQGAHYHVDKIIDNIIVMKYYPPGEKCPCEVKATDADGESKVEQKKDPADQNG